MVHPAMLWLFLSFFLSLCFSRVVAFTRILEVDNVDIAPDGYNRSAVLAGGTFPGPLLSANVGERFQIYVVNKLHDSSMFTSTSIHWHGLFVHGRNWADGTPSVTQCPIAPGYAFLYDFSVPDQSGTYWYHSHLLSQYCDGLRGPLVIYDQNDPLRHLYDIDDESTIITLADWYHKPAFQLNRTREGLKLDSTLINSRGRWNNSGVVDTTVNLTVISVVPQKRYRFRLLSSSCSPSYIFSIDNHTMTIIEADGVETQPLVVDSIEIFPGQRYSFVLTANEPIGNYWIRAKPNTGASRGFLDGINSAILRYAGAAEVEPTSTQGESTMPLREWDLHPFIPQKLPGGPSPGAVDQVIHVNLTANDTNYFVNGVSFTFPTLPILLQILSGQHDPRRLLPKGGVMGLRGNATIELTIPGIDVGPPHPMHLHGHNFFVIRSAGSATYNYDNPVLRDVVDIGGAGDNVTIRFRTDNAGPWFLHCHDDWHLVSGMGIVFAEDIPTIANEEPPIDWYNLCPIFMDGIKTQPEGYGYE